MMIARIVLETAGALIVVGGLFDLLTPKLPPNMLAACNGSEDTRKVVRELLRALGGALVAIGIAVLLIVNHTPKLSRFDMMVVLTLVLVAEGVNAISMYRARSPWQIPACFLLIAGIGLLLAR